MTRGTEDYVRFFDMLRLAPGALVVADNILSHDIESYVRHVRSQPGIESLTLPIGKGLEVSRLATNRQKVSARESAPSGDLAPFGRMSSEPV